MEHEQCTTHDPSSSTSAYCSTLEELDVVSSFVYTIAIEGTKELTSSRFWTSINYASDSDDEGYVRVLPGKNVKKYTINQIKLLEKIGEGGQGTIYTAKLDTKVFGEDIDVDIVVVKLYKGRRCGQWPEAAFGLHLSVRYICHFYGYCLEGDSFYLVMKKYDCSRRDVLDKQMKQDIHKGRPLPDVIALRTIIQIAIGMCSLHDNNIIHRDLKADNVFVETSSSGVPLFAYIGDFDIASNVVGTLYWRAPEVLQALKDGKWPVFTPKADVYSYAMTCYEILTGGVPLEEVEASNYNAVLVDCKRPKLPSELNPKLKGFLGRCWHQDPQARPTFKEIVVELKELHKELITGSKFVSDCLDNMICGLLDKIGASPEASLLELKTLLQATLVKYNEPDYLVLLMEVVVDLEEYQSTFGKRSMKEHPVLPFRDYYARMMMYDRLLWKLLVFGRLRVHIFEMNQICRLCVTIFVAICEGEVVDKPPIQPLSDIEDVDFFRDLLGWKEDCQARMLPYESQERSEVLEECLQFLLNAEYTSQMRCGRSGQVLSVCRQWLGIDW